MRQLAVLDWAEGVNGTESRRPSVRGVIIEGHRIAMVYSTVHDFYKFPGGGLEAGESHADALIREVAEETGLTVIPESITPYGMVHRREKGFDAALFIQDNYYYLCQVQTQTEPQRLDAYEADAGFTLRWVTPAEAIAANARQAQGSTLSLFDRHMTFR